MKSKKEENFKNNQYENTIKYLKKLKLEFCIPLFIDRNIKIEDIPHFTIDDFRSNNIEDVVACTLLGKEKIKSFQNIIEGDETDALLTMIKEHYDPTRIQNAINAIHEKNMTINKDNLYRELNNDIISHPQKLRELKSLLDKGGDDNNIKQKQAEIEKAKKEEIAEMKKKAEQDCVVCLERIATHFFSDCGHLCACKVCAEDKDKCVFCRTPGHPIEVKFPKHPKTK